MYPFKTEFIHYVDNCSNALKDFSPIDSRLCQENRITVQNITLQGISFI